MVKQIEIVVKNNKKHFNVNGLNTIIHSVVFP